MEFLSMSYAFLFIYLKIFLFFFSFSSSSFILVSCLLHNLLTWWPLKCEYDTIKYEKKNTKHHRNAKQNLFGETHVPAEAFCLSFFIFIFFKMVEIFNDFLQNKSIYIFFPKIICSFVAQFGQTNRTKEKKKQKNTGSRKSDTDKHPNNVALEKWYFF